MINTVYIDVFISVPKEFCSHKAFQAYMKKTSSGLTPPLFIGVSVPSLSDHACVIGVSMLFLFLTIFLADSGSILTMWYMLFSCVLTSIMVMRT